MKNVWALGLALAGSTALPVQAVDVGGWDVRPNGASSCAMWAGYGDGSNLEAVLHKDGKIELWVSSKSWRFAPDMSYQRAMVTLDVAGSPDAFPVILYAESSAWQGENHAYLKGGMEPEFMAALAASEEVSFQVEVAGRTFNEAFKTGNPEAAVAELRRCTAARPG